MVAKGEAGGGGIETEIWDYQMQTSTYRMDKQHVLLYNIGKSDFKKKE